MFTKGRKYFNCNVVLRLNIKLLRAISGSAVPSNTPAFYYPWARKSNHNTGAIFCIAKSTIDPNA